MTCSRCGTNEMYREDDRKANMVVHVCFKCGNRVYQGLPGNCKAAVRSHRWKWLEDGLSGQ